jgi:hypothetical protein
MRIPTTLSVLGGVALAFLPGTGLAQTFVVSGRELTGETRTVAGDGSVRTVVRAGLDGTLYDIEDNKRTVAHVLITMTITVKDNLLLGATVDYTAFGRHGSQVTVEIDPCWLEYANDREITAADFGEDVMDRVDAELPPRTLEPCVKEWVQQRLALLGAKTVEPFLKNGVTLVPGRS